MPVQVLCPLDLRYVDGRTWKLLARFEVESDVLGGRLAIEPPFVTDFNSIPRGLWNVLPPEDYGEAAVVHDLLYRTGRYNGRLIDRGTADRVHREFVEYRGAPAWKARAMYWGLRLGGWASWNRYRKAERSVISDSQWRAGI